MMKPALSASNAENVFTDVISWVYVHNSLLACREIMEGMNSLFGVPRLECPFCRLVGFEAMVTPVPPEPPAPHGSKLDRKDRIQAGMMHC